MTPRPSWSSPAYPRVPALSGPLAAEGREQRGGGGKQLPAERMVAPTFGHCSQLGIGVGTLREHQRGLGHAGVGRKAVVPVAGAWRFVLTMGSEQGLLVLERQLDAIPEASRRLGSVETDLAVEEGEVARHQCILRRREHQPEVAVVLLAEFEGLAEIGRSIGELSRCLGLELGGVDEDLPGEGRVCVAHRQQVVEPASGTEVSPQLVLVVVALGDGVFAALFFVHRCRAQEVAVPEELPPEPG